MDQTKPRDFTEQTAAVGAPRTRRRVLQHAAALGWAVMGVMYLGACAPPTLPALPASQRGRIFRIGYVHVGNSPPARRGPVLEGFQQGLHEYGYRDGENIRLEMRSAEGRPERYPDLIAELIAMPVDVLVVTDSNAIPLARDATRTIPIVVTEASEPPWEGIAESLARPGRNITGVTNGSRIIFSKRLEMLKEIVPTISRVGFLMEKPAGWQLEMSWDDRLAIAQALHLGLEVVEIAGAEGLGSGLQTAVDKGVDALYIVPFPLFQRNRQLVVDAAARHALPAVYPYQAYVESGGLLSYGPDRYDMWWRLAGFVDKILRGADPATTPMEQPVRFELIINQRTANTLGLTIPIELLLDATDVIR